MAPLRRARTAVQAAAMRRPKSAPTAPALRRSSVAAAVSRAVLETPVVDASTSLRQPAIAALRRAGIDDLLNDTRLVAEAVRSLGLTYRRFWHLTAERRSELLWRHLFVEHSPLSTAARGVLTSLRGLGLTPRRGDQAKIRRWFAEKRPDWLVDRVFEVALVESVVATVDPFNETERRRWIRGFPVDERFRPRLLLDELLFDWPAAARRLSEWDYRVAIDFGGDTDEEVQRFLRDWTERTAPVGFSASLPPTFRFPHPGPAARLLENVVLPECERRKRPFSFIVGEVPLVNPALRHAGGVRRAADLTGLENLLRRFDGSRLVVIGVAPGNDEEISALAGVFPHLHPAGLGTRPDAPEAAAALANRLSLLGTTFTPFVSRARVLEQLISSWSGAREAVQTVLTGHYHSLVDAGLGISRLDVERDVRSLLGGAFRSFSGLDD